MPGLWCVVYWCTRPPLRIPPATPLLRCECRFCFHAIILFHCYCCLHGKPHCGVMMIATNSTELDNTIPTRATLVRDMYPEFPHCAYSATPSSSSSLSLGAASLRK